MQNCGNQRRREEGNPVPQITLCNVTSSFSLGSSLNIEEIHRIFPRSIFDRKIYGQNAVVLKREKPKMTFLIWKTGKVVCTGAKSIDDARRSVDYLHKILTRAGIAVEKRTEAKIHNLVATTDLGRNVDIEKFLQNIDGQISVMYEPEQFPAAILKIPVNVDTEVTILLYGTGKLVCVGSRTLEYVKDAIAILVSKLKQTRSIP